MNTWIDATKKLPEFDMPVLAFCPDDGRQFVCQRVRNQDMDNYEYPYFWEDANVLDFIDDLNEKESGKHIPYTLYHPESVSHWKTLPDMPGGITE